MKAFAMTLCLFLALLSLEQAFAADTVPSDVQMPGTQPGEVSNLESPDKCDNCHGGYNTAVEPAYNWRGSMMAHAGRDPIFWATLAIAEQDFDGAGDLCIRCHSTGGWLAGRSTPTDGSGLAAGDSDGVECDYCHKLTDPADTDLVLQGVMNPPFVANDGNEGWYASGMSSIWLNSDKLGPYDDAEARHQFKQSQFHRSVDFCGTCHDVSNPVTGDLAHNFGQMIDPSPGDLVASGVPGSPVDGKAAFNNAPYRYGIVERTFSEYKSGSISKTRVDAYPTLPEELRGGALQAIYEETWDPVRRTADYADGTPRYYSCQSCHMRAVTGTGANKNGVPVRSDLPLHDMTGGNYWMTEAIEYLDGKGKLRLGGGMSALQTQAMHDGALRAQQQLQLAASLEVEHNEVKVINHTGHKLITGYPEGRRMWLNIKWYDGQGTPLREDGAYGPLFKASGQPVTVPNPAGGPDVQVHSILDLYDPNTKIYEAHMGMTPEWAQQLLDLGWESGLILAYDRYNAGNPLTLGQLASAGASAETFHFVLNNTVVKDNRIPPYAMSYDEARRRNAAPVPANQYEGTPGGVYEHYDEVPLNPPSGAASATIDLLYQPTSWEYIQFLYLANKGRQHSAFLGDEGVNMLEAWLETGMAQPYVMASTTWRADGGSCDVAAPTLDSAVAADKSVSLAWSGPADPGVTDYSLYYDQSGKAQLVAKLECNGNCTAYDDTGLTNGQAYCYKVTAWEGDSCQSAFSNILCATPHQVGQTPIASVSSLQTGHWVTVGKGRHTTTEFQLTSAFAAGDAIVFRLRVTDQAGAPVSGATAELAIAGPESTVLLSGVSGGDGFAEATWQTEAGNKKGFGATTEGAYTATVSTLDAPAYDWDLRPTQASFTIGVVSAQATGQHGRM
jgi:hypothetical protein